MKNYDMFRTAETVRAYKKYKASLPKDLVCDFCDENYTHTIKDYGTFRIVKNRFPYYMWDNWLVDDHLMLIPKRHIHDLKEFNEQERADLMKAMIEYDEAGYCIWIRDQTAGGRSVAHQHTHFIKISQKHVKGMVFHTELGNKYIVK